MTPKEHLVALESAWLGSLKPNTNGGLPAGGIDMSTDVRLGAGLKNIFASSSPVAEILDQINVVSIDSLIAMDDGMFQIGLGAGVNGAELAEVEVIMDMANYMLWLSLPGLCDTDVKIDMGAMLEQVGSAAALPDLSQLSIDPQPIIDMIKDYYPMALNGFETVDRKETSLQCNGVEQDAIELTAKMTSEELANVLLDVLKKAKDDARIKTLLNSLVESFGDFLDVSGDDLYEQLVEGIEEAIDSIENATFKDGDYLTFAVYTDKNNAVIGREAAVYSQDEKMGEVKFANVSNGEEFAVELTIDAGQTDFAFSGDGDIKNGKRDGEFAISMSSAGQSVDLVKFEIEDVDDNSGKLKIEPTAELLNMILGGAGYLDVALEVKWDEEKASFDVLMNDMLLVGLDLTGKTLDNASVTAPSGAFAECDTPEELMEWVQGIDIEKLFERLEEAGITGLPVFG